MATTVPTSTTWSADDGVHTISVTLSGNWTIWRGIKVLAEDDTQPSRPHHQGLTVEEQKAIAYRELRAHGLVPIRLTGDA